LKLARDGAVVIVSRDLGRVGRADAIAPTMQAALDGWAALAPRRVELYHRNNTGRAEGAFEFRADAMGSATARLLV